MKEGTYSQGTAPASFTTILAVAGAYFALARFGLLVAVPPGYASALWPAAGMALAAALLWGYRVWFGVWLGSFAANLLTMLNAGGATVPVAAVLAAVIASGAALQTVFGAYLVIRFVGYPLNLYRLRDVVRFLLLSGPLSCLVNASISVTSLCIGGFISAHDFWFNWFTWWVGDATGAMLLTPVVLSISVRHGEIWKLRRTSVTLPLCLLLFLIVSLYVFVSHKEQHRIEDEFRLKAGMIASQIKEEWDAHLDALYSEAGFFAASREVDRDRFRVFARYWLARHRSIQALEWIPRVRHAERSSYENAARSDGYPDFRVTEKAEQGQLVERSPQPEYFPVYYVEPYKGNEIALGFDLSSDKKRLSALNQTLMTGKPVGTGRITLVQETSGQYGFLVFMPVYDDKSSSPGEQGLPEALRGFAVGVFRIGDAMDAMVGKAEMHGIHIELTDLTAGQGEQLLYDSMATTQAGDDSKTASRSTSIAPWLATSLEIAARRWQLSFFPTADYLAEHRSFQAWSMLAGGLVFAACACAFLLVVTGRTALIEGLVSERTNALVLEIAERKQAEHALRYSEAKYRDLFAAVSDSILVFDADTFQFVDMNESALSCYGYTREEFLNLKALDITAEPEISRKSIEETIAKQQVRVPLRYHRRKDGAVFPVEISAVRFLWRERTLLCGVVRDITDRKRAEEEGKKLEEQLFQAQKMESVGRLAGGVAHDFNNMLGVIIGRAEMALQLDLRADKLRHNLEEILKAGRRSADLARQLLAFARKQIAIPKILDLNDTIPGMLKILKRLIPEDINLYWRPGLDLWQIKIDPSQVDQILANLMVNAGDAICGAGAITLKTENVVIDDSNRAETPESIPGQYVLLTVSDTGAGMSREVRENIFEPFFTTKELGKGTGLGLSTVYGIVKQNDGFIYVASEPGKGATFKIYLPRFEAETGKVPPEETAGKRRTGTETILLVEDDEAILNLGKVILENLGYTVLAAHTPMYAIQLAEDHPEDIHLLITDVVMPQMHGRELAEQLRVIRPDLKCLYMSGYTADAIAHRGILDEGLNFIQKPFGSDDLAYRVRQVLDQLG
jgi:PAS domain S-box-containing protein